MKKPFIGVTVAHHAEELATFPREFYVQSILAAGGIPLLIPPLEEPGDAGEVLAKLDGLLLSGGGDISPMYLGEVPLRGIKDCFPQRDLSEIALTRKALARDLPILGICRGIQVLAVAAGGKIYQDIPSQYPQSNSHHQTAPRAYPWHEVEVLESKLYQITGLKRISVNSFHHQAVSVLPAGFITTAVAPDGIIEGIELPTTRFCLGVQWHPEAMEKDKNSKAIFKAFIQAGL